MGNSKNMASAQKGGVKITELGTQLGVDPREIVAAAKEMAMENAKVPASWVTHGQAERLRAKFGGNKELKARLERIQRAKEESAQPAAPEPEVKVHHVKLGKKTFEADRRSVFGVIETPGGVRLGAPASSRLEAGASSHKPKTEAHAQEPRPQGSGPLRSTDEPRPQGSGPDATHAGTPAAPESPAPTSSAVNEPPKKFIGVQVAAPIRRAPEPADPRFGVVVPAPEVATRELKAPASVVPTSGLWDKLDDGRVQPEFMKEKTEQEPAKESAKPVPQEAVADAAPIVERSSRSVPESREQTGASAEEMEREPGSTARTEQDLRSTDESAPAAATEAHEEAVEYTPPPPKAEDVPLKWQPSHKAFGAKHKLKHKKHKLLKSAASTKHAEPKHKEKHEHKHTEPAHAHAPKHHAEHKTHAAHGHGQSEGILKRLVRKLFKK
ncbi:MAG TPA: hypothetical protein VKX17_01835 [Planctomycetota bacterium]|nr:hypothetical protein [Planctomycetota bacterium]